MIRIVEDYTIPIIVNGNTNHFKKNGKRKKSEEATLKMKKNESIVNDKERGMQMDKEHLKQKDVNYGTKKGHLKSTYAEMLRGSAEFKNQGRKLKDTVKLI